MKQIKVNSMLDVHCELWTLSKVLGMVCDLYECIDDPAPEAEALLAVVMLAHDRSEAVIEAIDASEKGE